MTSDEIKHTDIPDVFENQDLIQWLQEIAYQLAVMNERNDVPKLKTNPFGLADPQQGKRYAVSERGELVQIRNRYPNP